jgi:MFS family permease
VLLALAPVHAGYLSDLALPMVLMGLGAGLVFPSLMTTAMSGVQMHEAGLASGLVNTSMQVGGALGLAVLATLSSTRTHHLLATGSSPDSALTSGFHLSLVVGSGLLAAAIVAAGLILQAGRPSVPEPEFAAAGEELAWSEAA